MGRDFIRLIVRLFALAVTGLIGILFGALIGIVLQAIGVGITDSGVKVLAWAMGGIWVLLVLLRSWAERHQYDDADHY
jgi:hypothetical protein